MRKFFLLLILYMITPGFATPPDCRRNEIDCIGLCGRFIDKNNDGFCDLGRLSKPVNPTLLQDTTLLPQSAEPPENNPPIEEGTNILILAADTIKNQNCKPGNTSRGSTSEGISVNSQPGPTPVIAPAQAREIIDLNNAVSHPVESMEADFQEDKQEANASLLPVEMEPSSPSGAQKPYNLIFISALTLGSYLITHLLKRFGVISKTLHRRIWNLVLLLTFLVSGILGLVLVLQINYALSGGWYLKFLYLHVEFGISMALVAMIHALWHIKYYTLALGIRRGVREPKIRQLTSMRISKRIPSMLLRAGGSAK